MRSFDSPKRPIQLVDAETLRCNRPDIRLPGDTGFYPANDRTDKVRVVVLFRVNPGPKQQPGNSFILVPAPDCTDEKEAYAYMAVFYNAGWKPLYGDTMVNLTAYGYYGLDPFDILQARFYDIVEARCKEDQRNEDLYKRDCEMRILRKHYGFVEIPKACPQPTFRLVGSR